MRTRPYQQLQTRFEPNVEFEVTPVSEAQVRHLVRERFRDLQNRLVDDYRGEAGNRLSRSRLNRIANDAAALAWTTSYPLLVMPVLFAEKYLEEFTRETPRIEQRSRALMELVGDRTE